MPKAKKSKATVPHRTTLRSGRGNQQATTAAQPQVPVTRPSLDIAGSVNNPPRLTPNTCLDNRSSAAPSATQPPLAQNLSHDPDEEYSATQNIASGRRFLGSTVLEPGNFGSESLNVEESPTRALASRVSLLRRGLVQLSNLYPPSAIDEESQTQVIGSGTQFSGSMKTGVDNIDSSSTTVEPATQVVTPARFSSNEVERLANVDAVGEGIEEPSTQPVLSAAPSPHEVLGQLVNITPAVILSEEPSTQVVESAAPFSPRILRHLGNVSPAASDDEEDRTQVIPSGLPFSERIIGELGNVDLANVAISPTALADDDEYNYDEGPTIRYLSGEAGSDTISDGDTIPDRDPTPSGGPIAAQSQHSSNRSWASGSLTSSMRIAIGLHPKPLPNGRARPTPEDLGTPPPRYPCLVTITHYTCGHSYKSVEHHDRCINDDEPSERVLREATPDTPVLDEWGLPPSAQRPGRMPCSEKETLLLGKTECEGCIAER